MIRRSDTVVDSDIIGVHGKSGTSFDVQVTNATAFAHFSHDTSLALAGLVALLF
jgi:hypothetical protein